jgi:hypothetical protein
VRCGVFLASTTVDPAALLNEITLQNFVGTTAANNMTYVVVDGLVASSDYVVYCLAASPLGVVSAVETVLAWGTAVSTTCCRTIAVEQKASLITEGDSMQSFLSLTLSALPSEKLVVNIVCYNLQAPTVLVSAFLPATL